MKSIKILGSSLSKQFATFKSKLISKKDTEFKIILAVCFLISCLSFLNPKITNVFEGHRVTLGLFLMAITVFGLTFLWAFVFILVRFAVKYFYKEIKTDLSNGDILLALANLFGATLFILMILPFLKMLVGLLPFYLLI